MSTEFRPSGVACNLACQYCYQNVLRDAGWKERLDLDTALAAIEQRAEPFHVFGGEPLLLAYDDLERIFMFGLQRFGQNGIQTNGSLIDEKLVQLFRRYQVQVGISIDGPGPLNDARWAGTVERTREQTARSLAAIDLLVADGKPPCLMVQLTRCNGVGKELEALCAWLLELDHKGIPMARIHILEMDETPVRERFGLSIAENVTAFRRILETARAFKSMKLDVVEDKRLMLMMQDDKVACVFRGCDPLYTEAVMGIGGDGSEHKCGLTDKEGINFLRPDGQGFERYIALAMTPQAFGGCAECRFFAACKGQCPGTGIDGDWRNRSENCEVWRALFTQAEADLIAEGCVPLSIHPRRPEVEQSLLAGWSHGQNHALSSLRINMGIDLGEAH